MRQGVEAGVFEMRENGSLLEVICWFFKKKGRREAMLRDCEHRRRETGGAVLLIRRRCVEVEVLF